MRKHVTEALVDLDAKPVENPAWPGFPDVNYIEGVIELKQLDKWPIMAQTPVRIEHFTQQQKIFLDRRWRKGGNAYLLLQVGRTFLLFDGSDVMEIGRTLTQGVLRNRALKIWNDLSIMKKELYLWLDREETWPDR